MEFKLKCTTYIGATILAAVIREATAYEVYVLNSFFDTYYVLVHTNDKES